MSTLLKRGSILIGGGTGFIGAALSHRLNGEGYNVVAVSRKPGKARMSWEELERNGLPSKCIAVVNLAGQNVLDPTKKWSESFKQEVYESRIQTTRKLAQAIQNAEVPPRTFACISGVGFYKASPTEEYNEESPGGDHDYFSRLCKDWEAASVIPKGIATRRIIIRSGVVLDRTGGMVAQLYWPFFFFLGGPSGSGHQFMPWIHLDDLTRIFRHVIGSQELQGVFNGVAPEVITNQEFANSLGRAMSRPSFMPLPAFVLNGLFGPERAAMILEGQKVIPKRTLETGYKFKFPDIESATSDCARFMKTKGSTKYIQ